MAEETDLNRVSEVVFEAIEWRRKLERRETIRENLETRWRNQDAKADAIIKKAERDVVMAVHSGWKEVTVVFFQEDDLVVPANQEREWKIGGWKSGPNLEWLKQPYRRIFRHFTEFAKKLDRPMRCVIRPGKDLQNGTEGWLIVVGE